MKSKHILFLISGLFFVSTSVGQMSTLEQKGNKYFEIFTYDKAIEKYEELGVENLSTEGIRNLAEAYRLTHNTEKAEKYYQILSTKSDNLPEDLFMYAEMQLMNGKYTEGEDWMEKFNIRLAADGRGEDYVAKKGQYKKMSEDLGVFKIYNLDINSSEEDFGPAFYLEEIVFVSARKSNLPVKRVWNWNNQPYLNIYKSKKTDDNQLEGVEMLTKKVNKKFHEGPASYSSDGNFMVFTRNNYKEKSEVGERKLTLHYRIKDEEGKWGDIMDFSFNNKEYSVGHSTISSDGNTIYFASDMPGGIGGVDLYKIEKKGDNWTSPLNLGENINTEGNEMFPFIHEAGILFFASDGHVGLGGLDVFMARVDGNKYDVVQNLGYPVNTRKDDFSLILDKDQKYGYFASNRPGGKGSDDIYGFDLLKPFRACKEIKGFIKDKEGNLLPGTSVTLYSSEGDELKSLVVGDDGAYSFCVPEGDYYVVGNKEKYFSGKNLAKTKKGSATSMLADMVLEKDPGYSLVFSIKDSKTKKILEGVRVILIDNLSNGKTEFVTTLEDFQLPLKGKKVNDKVSYLIKLEKEGYFEKTVTYENELTKSGIYKVHEGSDLVLDPEVKDLAELVELSPINFDFNKHKIRPDAAIELDKIVEIMNKYPKMEVELGSHTDCRASKKYNEALSDRRAKASAAYIKERITNPDRIYGKGYGEEKILNGCECEGQIKSDCSEEEHEKNRRTEFRVINTGDDKVKVKNNSTDSFDK